VNKACKHRKLYVERRQKKSASRKLRKKMPKRKATRQDDEEKPLAQTRPQRASAAATSDKIQASLRTEKAGVIVLSSDDEEDERPPVQSRKSSKSGGKAKAPLDKKPNVHADESSNDEILLGHIISKCVGIQHYRGNGVRHAKEALRLKREPTNPYDSNAVAVHALSNGAKVGHVQRGDAIAIAKVADDPAMTILMVGQVERGADNVYGFPLRISFFGRRTVPSSGGLLTRTRVNSLLVPSRLIEPKRSGSKKATALHASASSAHGEGSASNGGSSSKSTARAATAAAHQDDADDDDDVEIMGEKTWAERDAELRAQAVVLE
jgi:hypothetical protein